DYYCAIWHSSAYGLF
nr:immunoglobulin light chain junction region [Macaca mulatta]MOX69326.1 immunoglobulin light chain junction region [Macaca mulatta]MOX70136.1 immunoglobulin light chain junction region [Macaca mulatta]MOX70193.1 immunoglobulin light chain junction region [Macaca mulatta]MOX70195.1 immunoglobulin light chain junction region [Macaca mulatta]